MDKTPGLSDGINTSHTDQTNLIKNKIQEISGFDDVARKNADLDIFLDFLLEQKISCIEEYLGTFLLEFEGFLSLSEWKDIFPWFKEALFPTYPDIASLKSYLSKIERYKGTEIFKGLEYESFKNTIRKIVQEKNIPNTEEYCDTILKNISICNKYRNGYTYDYYLKHVLFPLITEYPVLEDLKEYIVGRENPMNSLYVCSFLTDTKANLDMSKEEKKTIVDMIKNIEHNMEKIGGFESIINRFGPVYIVEGAYDDAYDHWYNNFTYQQFFQTIRLYEKISSVRSVNTKELPMYRIQEVLDIYFRLNGGITEDIVDGIVENLLPAIDSNAQAISLVVDRLNHYEEQSYYRSNRGKFFFEKPRKNLLDIITTPVKSSFDINKSLMKIKEITTLDIDHHAQNRRDALFFDGRGMGMRPFIDFIHRQDPMAHDFVSKMVEYYDLSKIRDESVGDEKEQISLNIFHLRLELKHMIEENEYLSSMNIHILKEMVFGKRWSNNEQRDVEHIEILRRLQKNTVPVFNAPNYVIDNKLSVLIKKCELDPNSFSDAINMIKYLNQKLVSYIQIGKVGMDVNEVLCIQWIDHNLMNFLNDAKLDNMSFLKSNDFLEILKFCSITNSVNFSEDEFENLKQKIQNTYTFSDVKDIVREFLLQNVSTLANEYKKMGIDDTGILWSGNLSYKLIELSTKPIDYNELFWERFNNPNKDDDGMM